MHAKHVTLHHHHHKPYRRRHVGLLITSLVGLFVVLVLLIQYRDVLLSGIAGSRNFVSDTTTINPNFVAKISSSYGFNVSFDTKVLYANAVDGETGKLYQNRELLKQRAYTKMQFVPLNQDDIADQSAVTVAYYPDIDNLLDDKELQKLAFEGADIDADNVSFVSSDIMSIGGQNFEKTIWQTKKSIGLLKNLKASFSIYSANVNGHPLVITVNEGFVDIPGMHTQYDELIQSIDFMPQTVKVNTNSVARAVGSSLVDTLLMAKSASAASSQQTTSISERIAALYVPAVVRVYNAYCTDVKLDGKEILRDACLTGSGSGFFVGQDGYLATNGHVVSMDPQDLAIYNSILYAVAGDARLVDYLAVEADFTESDVPKGASDKEAISILVEKLYKIEKERFTVANSIQNLLITLGESKPDAEKLIADTQARLKHDPEESIVFAEVEATDFRLVDGFDGFHASDVAIVKIAGKNYPIVKIGNIDDVTQGQELSILGFPGSANENNIVDSESSIATLTTGKVSKKTTANGTDNKLIETDTTIGHGNSGGPVFDNQGLVVGIATYTQDGSGSGDGTYNYIRDIKDLVSLADKSSVKLDTNSMTQGEWETGLDLFYEARYSKSLTHFEKVKELYPNHNKASEFIATAKKRIANGEDVQDFPLELAVAGASVLFAAVVISVALVVRHNKKHKVYKAGVAQGTVSPFEKGVPADPQHVSVSHPNVHPAAPKTPDPSASDEPSDSVDDVPSKPTDTKEQ